MAGWLDGSKEKAKFIMQLFRDRLRTIQLSNHPAIHFTIQPFTILVNLTNMDKLRFFSYNMRINTNNYAFIPASFG